MHIVEEQEFCEKAYPAFASVFDLATDERYHFSELISSRIIAYNTFSDSIDDAVPMRIIINAARAIKEKGCYFHLPCPNPQEPGFYYVLLDELEEAYYFNRDNYPNKNDREKVQKRNAELACRYPIFGRRGCTVIYSENGKWGTITSMCSSWGLLGGTNDFISKIKQDFPAVEQQIFSFLLAFHDECESDGTDFYEQIKGSIRSDLKHMYGLDIANYLIGMTREELFKRK
jgi:hypothetical protein